MDSSKTNSAKWQQISDSLLRSFENGLEDYIVGPADTVLCSEEGVKLKVHKHVLLRTPFMRDVFCCHCGPCLGGCPSVSEITILLPGVQIRELEIIVRFLYTGVLKCFRHESTAIKQILSEMFGYSPVIYFSDMNEAVQVENVACLICGEKTPIDESFEHMWTHSEDDLEDVALDISNGKNVDSSQCVFSESCVVKGVEGENYLKLLEEHYAMHKNDLREYLKHRYGYIVQEPAAAENGEVTMEVDSEQFGLADRVDSLSVHDEERLELQSEQVPSTDQCSPDSSEGGPSKKRRLALTTAGNVKNNVVKTWSKVSKPSSIETQNETTTSSSSSSRTNGHVSSSTEGATPTPNKPQQRKNHSPTTTKTSNSDNLICAACNQSTSRMSLERHAVTHYKEIFDKYRLEENENSQFTCPLCTKAMSNVYSTQKHLVGHHRIFKKFLEEQGKSIEDLYHPSNEKYGTKVLNSDKV